MKNSKKILIITYYWPPAGGPGVQRWLKFAKYLPEFGWEPTIYTPENPSYPLLDESLEKDVPKDIEIVKAKIWEPYQLAEKLNKSNKKFKAGQFDVGKNQSLKSKISIWVRGNFFIPDARVFWVKPSIKFLSKYVRKNRFDAFVTTGPPHSLHLIGLGLKKEFPNLKWIADFRDPWTEISYYKHLKLTKSSDKKHRDLEKEVFKTADITLATSYTDAENFRKSGANAICITNGFDIDDSGTPSLKKQKTNQQKFILSYIGVLEQLRNPNVLWEVLNDVLKENKGFEKDFQLKFAGRIDDQILQKIEDSTLKNHIVNLGYISHDKAVEEMYSSDVLLITNFPENASKGIIPGKIFEYLATGNSILSFGPENADVETILNETSTGKHFSYSDKYAVREYIELLYNKWKKQTDSGNSSNIENYSRKSLTKELVKVLESFS